MTKHNMVTVVCLAASMFPAVVYKSLQRKSWL